MKTRILLSLILTVFFASSSIANSGNKAKSEYQVDVQLTADNQIVVRYISETKDKVKVLVLNGDGDVLVSKKFYKSGHVKYTYDISNMPESNLIFKVIANNNTVCVERVSVSNNSIASIPVSLNINDYTIKKQEELLTETK